MTSVENDNPLPRVKGKGKAGHPEPSERTPLISHNNVTRIGNQAGPPDEESLDTSDARQRLWSKLVFVFLASLSICIILFLLLALVAYTYAARLSDVSPEDVLENALVIQGPYQVSVLNVTTDGGMWLQAQARVGVDAGSIIGVNTDDDEGTFKDIWKSFGRLGVRLIDRVTVDISPAQIFSQQHALLCTTSSPPFEIPLTVNPPNDDSWLSPISLHLFVVPTQNASDVHRFIHDSWHAGAASIHAAISSVVISGGSANRSGWRHMLKLQRLGIQSGISMRLPHIPGLPTPGEGVPLPSISQLITLRSFSVESESNGVTVHALATAINPASSMMNFTAPSIPFLVSLLAEDNSTVPVASVHTDPLTLTHPNITLAISGDILSLPPQASTFVSSFISRYLSLQPNPISITCPLFPSLVVDTQFPPPDSKPQILRNVTISNMKIKPTEAGFLASGTVSARVVLPKGMDITLNVTRVFPDVLVFDGEVPKPDSLSLRETRGELPDPLPDGAFGRIHPEDWLQAISIQVDGKEGQGSTFAVTADMVDVPLEVLPGRQKEFSNFVSKAIFGAHGALAGLRGTTDVGVYILGLPFEERTSGIDLLGLPFQGSVHVGKKGPVV